MVQAAHPPKKIRVGLGREAAEDIREPGCRGVRHSVGVDEEISSVIGGDQMSLTFTDDEATPLQLPHHRRKDQAGYRDTRAIGGEFPDGSLELGPASVGHGDQTRLGVEGEANVLPPGGRPLVLGVLNRDVVVTKGAVDAPVGEGGLPRGHAAARALEVVEVGAGENQVGVIPLCGAGDTVLETFAPDDGLHGPGPTLLPRRALPVPKGHESVAVVMSGAGVTPPVELEVGPVKEPRMESVGHVKLPK